MLPELEQLHWKQYNIPPKEGMNISRTYYRTMIEGQWAEQPETACAQNSHQTRYHNSARHLHDLSADHRQGSGTAPLGW